MSRLDPLPRIMLAPNGARRMKADHPALPISITEVVDAAAESFAAGAQALHAHVRDAAGGHTLDAGAYRELIAEMARRAPDMPVQITTEACGMFSAEAQRAVVLDVAPEGASVAIREMWPDGADDAEARAFYETCAERGVSIQHIAYAPDDLARILALAARGDLPAPLHALFVLGSYAHGRAGAPEDLDPFLALMAGAGIAVDWAVCAFGPAETVCLVEAARRGGKMRIGFENNLHHANGEMAKSNATRVGDLMRALSPGKSGA